MKYITLLIILNFTVISQAANWFPVEKVGAKTTWTDKSKCEQVEGQTCFDITDKDPRYHDVQTVQIDDPAQPIYKAPYNSGACDDTLDCVAKVTAAVESDPCTAGDAYEYKENAVLPGWTYYCTKLEGYVQKDVQSLVENAATKATVQAADTAAATLEAQLAVKFKDMGYGKRVIALFTLKSDAKGLNSTQRAQLANDFETIKRLLEAGSIQAARDTMAGMTPDGTLTTAQDKTDLLAELDAYLAQ